MARSRRLFRVAVGGQREHSACLSVVPRRRSIRPVEDRSTEIPVLARHRDAARVIVQTVAALVLTWFAMRWLGLPDMSWAMISTLLVVQASIDETMQATASRMGATLLGTALGLLSMWLVPGGETTLLRLILATTIINGLAIRWPGLRFGVVPGTILVLSSGEGLLGGALMRGIAIILGAVTGFVAATLVWPDRSRNRAMRATRLALETAGELLDYVLNEPPEAGKARLETLHTTFITHLQQARAAMSGARVGRRLRTGRPIAELLREVERLWHGLIMLERVLIEDAFNLPPDAIPHIKPTIEEVRASVQDALASVERSIVEGGPRPEFTDLARRLARTRAQVQALSGSLAGGRTPNAERAIGTLLFALDEVARHLIEILDTLQPGTGASPLR